MCRCTSVKESPQEEGRRLFIEGSGLSDVWGDCSPENFGSIGEVVDAFAASADDPEAQTKRTAALKAKGGYIR